MKKLINGVDNVVDEMLRGMAAACPQYVERVEGTDVMIRTGAKKTDKVVLISVGGSVSSVYAPEYFSRSPLSPSISAVGAVIASEAVESAPPGPASIQESSVAA